MNIFKILSDYDGKIREPSITSVLRYLLDANADHGLSSSLLKSFVEECNKVNPGYSKGIDWEQYDVIAEAKLKLDKENRTKKKIDRFRCPRFVLSGQKRERTISRPWDREQNQGQFTQKRSTPTRMGRIEKSGGVEGIQFVPLLPHAYK